MLVCGIGAGPVRSEAPSVVELLIVVRTSFASRVPVNLTAQRALCAIPPHGQWGRRAAPDTVRPGYSLGYKTAFVSLAALSGRIRIGTRRFLTDGLPITCVVSGDEGARTLNPCLAKAVLSQLSYVP